MRIQKKKIGGGGGGRGRVGGVRVDVIEELKFLGKFKKKIWIDRYTISSPLSLRLR